VASALHQAPQPLHTIIMHWTDSLYTPRLSLLDPGHRSPAAITTSQSALKHACPILAPLVTGISVHPRIMTSVLVNVSVSVKADLKRKVALCRLRLAQWLVWQLPWPALVI
jgi:hypothetical protein